MHRVLQRLDYQRTSEDTLGDALADLVRQGHLTPEELAQVDQPALLWLFSTPLGNRMRQAAIQSSRSHQLLRELNFLWSLPARQAVGINPATPPSLSVDTILNPGTTKPHTSDIDIQYFQHFTRFKKTGCQGGVCQNAHRAQCSHIMRCPPARCA